MISSFTSSLGIKKVSNLVLLLDASLYTSGSTWYDNSNRGNDATIYNAPSNDGTSFTLNGTNQYFDVKDGFADFTKGITVLSFVNFDNASNYERIIDFANGQANDNILFCRQGTSTNLWFEIYNSSGVSQLVAVLTGGITNNAWGFYGARLDGSSYKVFNATTSSTGSTSVLPANVNRTGNYIGRSHWPADAWFQNKIGIVAIYDRPLEDAEITAFFNKHKSTYGL